MSASSDDSWLSQDLLNISTSGRISQSAVLALAAKHCDFLSFLGIAQNLGIDFLPITWQPALDNIGQGATAEVRQALIALQTSFAFKRFLPSEPTLSIQEESKILRALIAEILVLGHQSVRDHPNVLRLEGVCWDVNPKDDKILPVLVFQKARYGDLHTFMELDSGMKLTLEDRLDLCADIATAIMLMHCDLRIIHGDIKPQNVLIFEDESRHYVGKVADFGYSSCFASDDDLLKLPCSKPWHAPEYHHRPITPLQAKKMDLYSFGMVCLWLLFYNSPQDSNRNFDADLKTVNSASQIASQSILAMGGLSTQCKASLIQFFDAALASDPSNRSSNIQELLELLAPHR